MREQDIEQCRYVSAEQLIKELRLDEKMHIGGKFVAAPTACKAAESLLSALLFDTYPLCDHLWKKLRQWVEENGEKMEDQGKDENDPQTMA